MKNKKIRILISGGDGNLSTHLQDQNSEYELYAPSKKEMDVRKIEDIEKAIDYFSPHYFLHCAALTRPMFIHEKDPILSIQTNIIGTANISSVCIKHEIKLIYISTDYVYPGKKGDYKENDNLNPFTNYGWSKLGGECAVRLCRDSLILRVCMTQRPFVHQKALVDSKKSLLYIDEAARICLKLLNESGIVNVGGDSTNPYDFAKKDHPNIGKIYRKDVSGVNMAADSSMDLTKLNRILA
jgi:dTDP-4-dehydrorhamnose reductase